MEVMLKETRMSPHGSRYDEKSNLLLENTEATTTTTTTHLT